MGEHYTLRERLQQRAFHLVFRLTRSMTLGVRALVLRDGPSGKQVWLVRHTYVHGWFLPGGGVERGETVMEALRKELREEGNLVAGGEPEMVACMANLTATLRDHVCYFIVDGATQTEVFQPNREIAEAGWFALDALPDGLTRATQARIEEYLAGTTPPEKW